MKWTAITIISIWIIELIWLGYQLYQYKNQNED